MASGEVKIWVTAPPAEGEANEAVVRVLAKALDVPKTSVQIVAGHASRNKRVVVEGLTAAEAMARLSVNSG